MSQACTVLRADQTGRGITMPRGAGTRRARVVVSTRTSPRLHYLKKANAQGSVAERPPLFSSAGAVSPSTFRRCRSPVLRSTRRLCGADLDLPRSTTDLPSAMYHG
jgi:hypothetical protein